MAQPPRKKRRFWGFGWLWGADKQQEEEQEEDNEEEQEQEDNKDEDDNDEGEQEQEDNKDDDDYLDDDELPSFQDPGDDDDDNNDDDDDDNEEPDTKFCIGCCEPLIKRDFSEKEWSKLDHSTERRCLNCYERFGRQEKMPTFQVPGEINAIWGGGHHVPDFNYEEERPTLHSLIGEYDIIFMYDMNGDQLEGISKNRATKGKLEIKLLEEENENEEEEEEVNDDDRSSTTTTTNLKGSITIDKSVRNDLRVHWQDFSFTCLEDDQYGSEITFDIDDTLPEDHVYYGTYEDGDKISGSIQKICTPLVVKYAPEYRIDLEHLNNNNKEEEENDKDDDDDDDYRRIYFNSIKNDNKKNKGMSVEHAKDILKQYKSKNCYTKLMKKIITKNSNGPISMQNKFCTDIAKHISAFIGTNKPPPVFIFEPGDLKLDFQWFDDRISYITTLVARPVE